MHSVIKNKRPFFKRILNGDVSPPPIGPRTKGIPINHIQLKCLTDANVIW